MESDKSIVQEVLFPHFVYLHQWRDDISKFFLQIEDPREPSGLWENVYIAGAVTQHSQEASKYLFLSFRERYSIRKSRILWPRKPQSCRCEKYRLVYIHTALGLMSKQ